MKNKKKLFIILSFLVLLVVAIIISVNLIQTHLVSSKYKVLSFSSEDEMLETVEGSWKLYDSYLYIDSKQCIYWDDENNNNIESKHISFDYQNGRIVFDNKNYYDVVLYQGNTYIRITPNAKSEEYYYLYEKCNVSVPDDR